jgi:hypothetical protein
MEKQLKVVSSCWVRVWKAARAAALRVAGARERTITEKW